MTLIERIEAATGADRELDVCIYLAVHGDCQFGWKGPPLDLKPGTLSAYHASFKEVINADDAIPDDVVPRYTASLDAAMSMIPGGWRAFSADMSIIGRTRLMIEGPKSQLVEDEDGYKVAGDDWYVCSVADTPALALIAAALKARGISS